MITQLESKTRKLLIKYRCLAMRGGSDSAVGQVDSLLAASPESIVSLERLALLLLKAEILYLDCREAEALEVFKSAIDDQLETFPQEIKFVVAQNRRDVA